MGVIAVAHQGVTRHFLVLQAFICLRDAKNVIFDIFKVYTAYIRHKIGKEKVLRYFRRNAQLTVTENV